MPEVVASLAALLKGPDLPPLTTIKSMLKVEWPAEWRMRVVSIPGQVKAMKVPQYIVRIDVDEPGLAGTHGWQVRYRRKLYRTQFFSDAAFDLTGMRKGTPKDSLEAAKIYLAAIWSGKPVKELPAVEAGRKRHPTGMPGVRVIWRTRAGGEQCYVRVDDIKGKPLASMYVSTEATFTDQKLSRKIREGKRRRREYLESIGRGARRETVERH